MRPSGIIVYVVDSFSLLFSAICLVAFSLLTSVIDQLTEGFGAIRMLAVGFPALLVLLSALVVATSVAHLSLFRARPDYGKRAIASHIVAGVNATSGLLLLGILTPLLSGGIAVLLVMTAVFGAVRGIVLSVQLVSDVSENLPTRRSLELAKGTYAVLVACVVVSLVMNWTAFGMFLSAKPPKKSYEPTDIQVTSSLEDLMPSVRRGTLAVLVVCAVAWTVQLASYVMLAVSMSALLNRRAHWAHAVTGCIASYSQALAMGAVLFYWTQNQTDDMRASVWLLVTGSVTALGVAVTENTIMYSATRAVPAALATATVLTLAPPTLAPAAVESNVVVKMP